MQSHRYWMVHSSDRWWIKMIVIAITFLGLFTTGELYYALGTDKQAICGTLPTKLCVLESYYQHSLKLCAPDTS